MAKADVIAAQKAAVLAGQDAALEAGLEAAYDGGALGAGFTQADIDAAVAAKGIQDQAAVDALSAQVLALQADDDAKTKIIAGIQALLAPPVQP